jgi:hypothetical protein
MTMNRRATSNYWWVTVDLDAGGLTHCRIEPSLSVDSCKSSVIALVLSGPDPLVFQ